jgi:hypothetical protein
MHRSGNISVRRTNPGCNRVIAPTGNRRTELQLDRDLLSQDALNGIVNDWLAPSITELLLQDLLSSKKSGCEESK